MMKVILNGRQVYSFQELPNCKEICTTCTNQANHYIVTQKEYEFVVCQGCFEKIIALEAMLASEV